jgi:hypothetical protein
MKPALSESPTDPERAGLIDAVTSEAAGYLGVDLVSGSPASIVKVVDAVTVELVFGRPHPIPESEEPNLVLGCLWGAQMVREFGWSWADIRIDDVLDVAVVSPARDMAIYPFTFVADCIAKHCVCTVALSFNMLLERKGETMFPARSYESVMTHIRHIVPPYTLEKKANKAPEPTTMAVTSRAPSSTSRASHGRGSS